MINVMVGSSPGGKCEGYTWCSVLNNEDAPQALSPRHSVYTLHYSCVTHAWLYFDTLQRSVTATSFSESRSWVKIMNSK